MSAFTSLMQDSITALKSLHTSCSTIKQQSKTNGTRLKWNINYFLNKTAQLVLIQSFLWLFAFQDKCSFEWEELHLPVFDLQKVSNI